MGSPHNSKLKIIFLLLILTAIPAVTILNQQMQTYQTEAHGWNFWGRRSKQTISYTGYVFEDKNNNQVKDTDEVGIAGVGVAINTRDKRENKETSKKNVLYPMVYTDSFGFFKYELPRNAYSNSIILALTLEPPEGFVLTTSPRVARSTRKKAQRVITIGLMREEVPQPVEPTPLPTTESSPSPFTTPVETPIIDTPTPSPTRASCAPEPLCDGEIIIVEQQDSTACPQYVCHVPEPVN